MAKKKLVCTKYKMFSLQINSNMETNINDTNYEKKSKTSLKEKRKNEDENTKGKYICKRRREKVFQMQDYTKIKNRKRKG